MKPADLLLGILVTVIWGSNFSVIEAGLRDLDPFLLTGLRFTFTAFPLILFLRRPSDVSLAVLAAYGLLFGVGLWWVVNLAMALGLSPGLSSLVLQFSAFFTLILSAVILRERIGRIPIVGMVVAAAGLLLVIAFTDGHTTLVGVALVLLAALSWSACNLIVKRYKPADMIAFIVWSSVFSAPVLFLLTWLKYGNAPFNGLLTGLTLRASASVLFQAYVTTVFGYMVWNNLMKKYPASSVAPLSLIVPVSGVVTSYLVYHETFAPMVWVGVVVMLVGVAIFVLGPRLGQLFTRPRRCSG
ncbi:EamA family transporter [Luteibacter flocculans]|uniref:EamA family transporter n=1 Tax=Luteibacter flocculans TaxID=2780091 RepID=A0ABY4T5R9_9GAMM|nr:EamA family transporter [Luteibacter flocculans]URL58239.1 EamA family transporter [Luteibacter flocculans]